MRGHNGLHSPLSWLSFVRSSRGAFICGCALLDPSEGIQWERHRFSFSEICPGFVENIVCIKTSPQSFAFSRQSFVFSLLFFAMIAVPCHHQMGENKALCTKLNRKLRKNTTNRKALLSSSVLNSLYSVSFEAISTTGSEF